MFLKIEEMSGFHDVNDVIITKLVNPDNNDIIYIVDEEHTFAKPDNMYKISSRDNEKMTALVSFLKTTGKSKIQELHKNEYNYVLLGYSHNKTDHTNPIYMLHFKTNPSEESFDEKNLDVYVEKSYDEVFSKYLK